MAKKQTPQTNTDAERKGIELLPSIDAVLKTEPANTDKKSPFKTKKKK